MAGTNGSLGQIPAYSWIRGSLSCKGTFSIKIRELLLLTSNGGIFLLLLFSCENLTFSTFLNNHYLHQKGVLCHSTEVNLAVDFYTCSSQTFLRKTAQE